MMIFAHNSDQSSSNQMEMGQREKGLQDFGRLKSNAIIVMPGIAAKIMIFAHNSHQSSSNQMEMGTTRKRIPRLWTIEIKSNHSHAWDINADHHSIAQSRTTTQVHG
jgi:hypothetical protein